RTYWPLSRPIQARACPRRTGRRALSNRLARPQALRSLQSDSRQGGRARVGADEAAGGATSAAAGVAMSAADRALAIATAQVAEYMRKKKLALDDLVNVGGDDLKSPDPKRAEKARRVSACWELMARLGTKFVHIEQSEHAPRPIPASTA